MYPPYTAGPANGVSAEPATATSVAAHVRCHTPPTGHVATATTAGTTTTPSGVTHCAAPAPHSSSAGTATAHVNEPTTPRAGLDARFPPTAPPDTAPAVVSYSDLPPSPPGDHQLSRRRGVRAGGGARRVEQSMPPDREIWVYTPGRRRTRTYGR
ncbi:hypothetical protein GCM10010345_21370 [Streptomyces canarius]|uniref:Uncharacterized protein n=1 Tax=Streptomyces canarius TaxID=285453 RepID=A0ABQ3CM96_9ACTN|nr:hypothetical protein GCM10010345_21370 [Streptomyces canarius]